MRWDTDSLSCGRVARCLDYGKRGRPPPPPQPTHCVSTRFQYDLPQKMQNAQTTKAKSNWLRASALMLLLSLCGCATSYRPMKNGQGYSDTQIAADRFLVTFQGNGQTSADQASDFAMLRAAQLTLQHGFSYFAVTDITNTSSLRAYTARQEFYTDYPPGMGLPPPTFSVFQPYQAGYIAQYEWPAVYFRPGQRLWIQCFKTQPDKPFTYDAAALLQSLSSRYRLSTHLSAR
jgi:hypothetical protein